MNKYLQRAKQMRLQINSITTDFTDEQALNNKELYQDWNGNGVQAINGQIVFYKDEIYRVLQDHITQSNWAPDVAVSLYARILTSENKIKKWEQPDSTNGYMTGAKVYFPTENDDIYESLIDNNIWSPAAHPAGWKKL